jgi:hypothetical protein
MRMRRGAAPVVLAILAAVTVVVAGPVLGGCGKRAHLPTGPSPEVTGLAAVPSTADVVVGLDIVRLADSPIVERSIEMLLAREPDLASRWQSLRESCKLELAQVNRLMIALGPPPPGGRLGTGPMILIATGKLSEPDIVKCARDIVGKGGGSLTVKNREGRTLYQVKDGARTMFIAFGRPDTVILGNHDAYVQEAVGGGNKALDNPELAGWIKLANQNAPVWVVGRVADRLKTSLVRASGGTLKAGAKAYVGSLDLTDGVKGELRALMESPEDAKQLESVANLNLVGLSWAAQREALARIVQKVSIKAQGDTVRFSVPLTMDDVNRVLLALDDDGAPAQDSPPAGGSAPTPPAP